MPGHQLRQSAEFGNHERAHAMLGDRQHRVLRGTATPLVLPLVFGDVSVQRALVRIHLQRAEIVVHAVEVAAALVVPAACHVDRARGIKRMDAFRRVARVELAPAFVEQHPGHNRRMPGKHVHHRVAGARPVTAVIRIVRTQCGEMLRGVVAVFVPRRTQQRRLAVGGPRIVFAVHAAAGDRVLPHHHAQMVTMVVPARRLDFDMLTQHVETDAFHGGDVVDQRGVARRGQQPIGPIPLVEHAFDE